MMTNLPPPGNTQVPIPDLPTGTVTLFFTDIEGSTRLLQQLGARYADVLADCRQIMRMAFQQWHGHEVDTQGDAFFVVFARATDAVAAAVACQRALAQHPWPEDVTVRVRIGLHTGEPQLTADGYIGVDVHHAARIMGAGHGGQVLLSQTTSTLVEQDLPAGVSLRDLGEHRLKDLRRPSRLVQLVLADLPSNFPPIKTLDTHPNNLPIQLTPFIGRDQDVAAVYRLLAREEVRMATLTGPGGVGKTRLALQVAAELSDLFADGVFLVALAPFSDPQRVMPAIAQMLGIGEASELPPLVSLQTTLKEKHLLLVLDNMEQVAAAAVQVIDLLTACPHVKVLVTSRVALHVRAEHEYTVPPLAVPNPKRLPNLTALSQYAAVALFIERALAVKPDFAVTNANAPAVAGICARLDGLPLAIELAAARVKVFPPQTLLARLEQGLGVLSGGARDLPARQQTLRAAIAWSYDLLPPAEQMLFRRLAVFVDGWTWEAAETICQAAGPLANDILEVLASLVDQSLVRQEEQAEGEARFWMLQVLREFGLERLVETGELEATRTAHATYYLALAEEAEPQLRGNQQTLWFNRLEQEYENLRAALSWLLERARNSSGTEESEQEAGRALRLSAALGQFWYVRGYFREGLTFLEQALAHREHIAAPVQAKALYRAGELNFFMDNYARAEAWSEESLTLYRTLDDKAGMAASLFFLGAISWARSAYTQARLRYEEANDLFQVAGDTWGRGRCLTQLARIAQVQGEYERAAALLEESLRLYQALGDLERISWVLALQAQMLLLTQGAVDKVQSLAEQSVALRRAESFKAFIAIGLNVLGQFHLARGAFALAYELTEESVAAFKEVGDRAGTAESLITLARILAEQGQAAEARALYQESLTLLHQIQDREITPSCLEGLAAVLAQQGMAEQATRLWGAAEALRETIGTPLPPVYRVGYEQAVEAARVHLGVNAFAAAWAEGHIQPLEQAIADALKMGDGSS